MFLDFVEDRIVLSIIVLFFLSIAIWQTAWFFILRCRQATFTTRNKHVLITGGSRGLGLALAALFARRGARVTIVARDENGLKDAKTFIEDSIKFDQELQNSSRPLQPALRPRILPIAADVTRAEDIQRAVQQAEAELGPVHIVLPCAGAAITGYFAELPTDAFEKSISLNYLGQLYTIRAVVPSMMRRKEGHVVCVSSGLALTGYLGYASYCPAKFAVRGLSYVLRNELLPYNIKVYNAFPPAMDTPGYQEENKTKPDECRNIEKMESVYRADDCAQALYDSLARGEQTLSCGDPGINVLARLTMGMWPRNNSLADFFLLPWLVLAGNLYSYFVFDRQVMRNRDSLASPRLSGEANRISRAPVAEDRIDLRRSSADSVGTYGATAAMLPIDGPVIEPADVDGGDLDESEEKRVLR